MTIGERLAALRRVRGMTQEDLGKAVGMSRRNVAYYESQAGRLPAALLPEFARALKTSLNQILGEEPVRDIPKNTRLWKRFLQMEDLSKADQRAVLQYIEMMLDRSVRRRSHG